MTYCQSYLVESVNTAMLSYQLSNRKRASEEVSYKYGGLQDKWLKIAQICYLQ